MALLGGQQAAILQYVEERYMFDMVPINQQLIKKPGLGKHMDLLSLVPSYGV